MTTAMLRTGLIALLIVPAIVRADELDELRARVARLEATVQELTVQLADALAERRRLEAALAAVPATPPAIPAAPAPTAERPVADATPADAVPAIEETVFPDKAAVAAASAAAAQASAACDIDAALQGYDGSGKANRALGSWLKSSKRLAECSDAQLRQLRKAVKWDWLGYQKEVLALIDAELEARE